MHNVHVKKDNKYILQNVNLKINAGEHIAILGPNGSGKSSLVKTMMGEYRNDSSCGGFVKLNGKELWNLFEIRKAFGFVSNDTQETFKKNITVHDAVLSGFFGSVGTNRSQKIDKNMESRADCVLKSVCADKLKDRLLEKLSSGELKRVMMARALVNNPEALILDEPMNSLDLNGKYLVKKSIERLAKEKKSILMVTHDPMDIGPEFERIVMIKDGKIYQNGGIEIITSDALSYLYDIPITVHRFNNRIVAEY